MENDQWLPSRIAKFRDSTVRIHSKMEGITYGYRFMCKRCNTNQHIAGRKELVPGSRKFGYICKSCSEITKNEE